MRAIQEAALDQAACPLEAYSYDLHVVGAIKDCQQVAQMTLDDWQQDTRSGPCLGSNYTETKREGHLKRTGLKKQIPPN